MKYNDPMIDKILHERRRLRRLWGLPEEDFIDIWVHNKWKRIRGY